MVLTEITPLSDKDCFYIIDRHKSEFTYPVHRHAELEINFIENAAGARRIVGDSVETIGDYDLVLIGGDMVTVHPSGRTLKGCEALADLLDRLPDVPVLYAYGNHEARLTRAFPEGALLTAQFEEILSERGIPVLRDRRVPVFRGQDCILVSAAEFGKEHYKKGFKRPLPEGFFTEKAGERDEGRFEILLAHCPLYLEDAAAWGADLTLSGHFHGGTVRLPWAGGVLTPQFQLFYPYCKGRFAFGRKTGIVSAGLGTHTINIRINNPPDIVTVVLKKER